MDSDRTGDASKAEMNVDAATNKSGFMLAAGACGSHCATSGRGEVSYEVAYYVLGPLGERTERSQCPFYMHDMTHTSFKLFPRALLRQIGLSEHVVHPIRNVSYAPYHGPHEIICI